MSAPTIVRARGASRLAFTLAAIGLAAGVADVPAAVAAHDLSLDVVPTYAMTLALIVSGVVVARHQPRNAIGWLLLASALFFALNGLASDYSVLDYRIHDGGLALGPLAVVLQPSWAPAIVCFALSILLFPDGRMPGRAWRWAMWAFLAVGVAWLCGAFSIALGAIASSHPIHVNPGGDLPQVDNPTGGDAWWGSVQDVFFTSLGLSALAWITRQLLELRRARGERRLQLKWFTGGAVLSIAGGAASVAAGSGAGGVARVIATVLGVGLVAFPISIGVAVARYRLYEIDRIVSRTISYAIITLAVVGSFVGVVALTTDVLPFSSRLGVAISTLAGAALFNLLRVRVQRGVDRRFNRARYDAEAILAQFTARMREAVEIDAIRRELLAAVDLAVEPASASVWIRSR